MENREKNEILQEDKDEKKKRRARRTMLFSFSSERVEEEKDSAEKPDFVKEKKLFQKRKFRRQYRLFRKGGLGKVDSFFNTVYIILCEKSVENEKNRRKKQGEKNVHESVFLEFHSLSLKVFSLFVRFFRGILAPILSGAKAMRGKKNIFLKRPLREYGMTAALILVTLFVGLYIFFTLRNPAALCAEINGEVIGIVKDTSVVDRAVARLEDNAKIVLGTNFQFPYEVNYSFTRRSHRQLTDPNEIFQTLFDYVRESIVTGSGLYVDDTLVAVCKDEETIQTCLDELVAAHTEGDSGIFNDIKIVTQAYPTTATIPEERLRLLLEEMLVPLEEREKEPISDSVEFPGLKKEEEKGEEPPLLSDLEYVPAIQKEQPSNQPQSISNIKLDFYTAKVVNYTATIPYETVYQESSQHYTTMADVTTQGVDGAASVEARVYYVNGKEVRREILSQTVTKEAQNRVISIGTKLLPEDLGYTSFTKSPKRLIVPLIANVSYYWGVREDGMHYAWDIPSPKGTNIYASASGRVVVVRNPNGLFTETPGRGYSGYGYCVVIQHDDGFSTLYAHCSKVIVTLGQEVKQGEKIAEVGNTGRSEGNHVHWEVMVNDQKRNPALYTYEGTATIGSK